MIKIFYKSCHAFSLLLLFINISHCGEKPKIHERINVPVDSTAMINHLLEKDSQKQIVTQELVYELGNGESYIKGELIKRTSPDTLLANKTITLKAHSEDPHSLLPKIQLLNGEIAITVNQGAMKGARKVSFNVVNKPLALFLSEDICKDQPFDYKLDGSLLIFFKRTEDTIKLKTIDSINYHITAPKETQLHLKLPDRTNIWLNAGTIISFAGDLTKNRIIRMTGEGYFDINESKDSLSIKTEGNHNFTLRHGTININTFDWVSHVPNPNYLPATDQEISRLDSEGKLYDINCNPCSLDSLIDVWNQKGHRIVADRSRLKEFAEPVYISMVHSSFNDIFSNIIEKQKKIGGYFAQFGELIITAKTGLETLQRANYFAVQKSGETNVCCGNCKEEKTIKGNEFLTFGKFDLRKEGSCDPAKATSWTKGFFEEDTALHCNSLYESMGRWYDCEMAFPLSWKYIYFDGKFPMQSSLKSILEIFKINNIQYELRLTSNGEKLNILFK